VVALKLRHRLVRHNVTASAGAKTVTPAGTVLVKIAISSCESDSKTRPCR